MELRPADLAKEWKAGKFRPVYYLVGEDDAARAAAVSELKKLFGADAFNLAEFSEGQAEGGRAVVAEAMTLPVFAERRLVIVHGTALGAEARATLAAYLKDPVPTTTLVLQSGDRRLDAKDALGRAAAAAGAACVFSPLTEDQAVERLKAAAKAAGKTLAEGAADALVAEVGPDWALLKQELEKALLYAAGTEVSREQVLACLGYRKAADPFALTRLIQERRLKESLAHFRRLCQEGKPDDQAFRAMAQLSGAVGKQLKAKRMLKSGAGQEAVFKTLRLNSYWDRDYLPKLARLAEDRLMRDLKLCLETEAAIKSRSWLEPKLEVERLIAALCK